MREFHGHGGDVRGPCDHQVGIDGVERLLPDADRKCVVEVGDLAQDRPARPEEILETLPDGQEGLFFFECLTRTVQPSSTFSGKPQASRICARLPSQNIEQAAVTWL